MIQFQNRNNSASAMVVNSSPGVEIKGRTLVNLLGKDGNFEVDSNGDGVADGWDKAGNYSGSLYNLDTTTYKYGSKAQKVVKSTAVSCVLQKEISSLLTTGKYYVVIADGKSALVSNKVVLGSTSAGSQIGVSPVAFSQTAMSASYSKFTYTSGSVFLHFGLMNQDGAELIIDGIRLYEIDSATYAKIDVDPEYTGDKLAQKFPYVDSVQFKSNSMVTVKGKNLIPAFDSGEWTLNTKAVASGYGLTLNATTGYQISAININVTPNTQYTFSLSGIGAMYSAVSDITTGVDIAVKSTTTVLNYTFTTPSACRKIQIKLFSLTSGTFTFTNPQLELGSIATTFEPQVKTQSHTSIKLADGESVYLLPSGQSIFKQVWVKDVKLTGDLAWVVGASGTGYKTVTNGLSVTGIVADSQIVIKNDGKLLSVVNVNNYSSRAYDMSILNFGVSTLFQLLVNDINSGWTNITPSLSDIQAYFYGWKMCASDGSTYVSGTKYWKKIVGTTTEITASITSTIPTATYSGYTPYTLHYKLATPAYYTGTYNSNSILTAGSTISVPFGPVQVEQKTGIDFTTKTDLANKYANTVDVGTQVDNPTVMPMYQYRQNYQEQNVGYFDLTGMVSAPTVAINRQGRMLQL